MSSLLVVVSELITNDCMDITSIPVAKWLMYARESVKVIQTKHEDDSVLKPWQN